MIFDIWINENQDTLRKPRAPSVYIYIHTYVCMFYLFVYLYMCLFIYFIFILYLFYLFILYIYIYIYIYIYLSLHMYFIYAYICILFSLSFSRVSSARAPPKFFSLLIQFYFTLPQCHFTAAKKGSGNMRVLSTSLHVSKFSSPVSTFM